MRDSETRFNVSQLDGEETGSRIPLRPSYMIGASVVARYCLGSILILALGAVYVPKGEYDQYIVSHAYALHSLAGWLAIVICTAAGYFCVDRLMHRERSRKDRKQSIFSGSWMADKKNVERVTQICITTGVIQLLFVIVAISTGSEDRGSVYDYWTLQQWKPTSIFISVERVFSIFYGLTPLVVVNSRLKQRVIVVSLYSVITVASFSLSGRGTFLYPLLYTLLGMSAVVRRETLLKWMIGFALLVTVLVPGMAAIRDLPTYDRYGSTDLIERALLYVKPSSYGENIRRRIFALGREIYACSDGFVYRDSGSTRYGFGDLDLREVVSLALPRFIGGNKEKMDGSRIAQKYMGVEKKTWFPCITIQGDLYRRGGAFAIAVGGLIYGVCLYVLDRCWIAVSHGNRMYNIVLTLLPMTMLKAAPTGTVREIISFVFYELAKYVAVAWILTCLEESYNRLARSRDT